MTLSSQVEEHVQGDTKAPSSRDKALGNPALLVIDMQEHFRDMAQHIIPELNDVIDACRSAGWPIIFSQHGHKDPDSDVEHDVLVQWWGADSSIRKGSAAWHLMPELHHEDADCKVDKSSYDCFVGTGLAHTLKQQGVDTVIVAGTMTNLCCETSARSAFCHNFRVKFLSDGTATADKQVHQATLSNIEFGFGEVLTCQEIVQRIPKPKRPKKA
jgi:nicotinamidase-related amidase